MPEPAFAVWLTGLAASGKSTITACLKSLLTERGIDVEVLESDVLRQTLGGGYDPAGRDDFYRRMSWIGTLLAKHGIAVIFDATANRRSYRDAARKQIPRFFEIFIDVPLEVCRARDPKGIYATAANDVPGLQVTYEPPENPDAVIDGLRESPFDAARRIAAILPLKSGNAAQS